MKALAAHCPLDRGVMWFGGVVVVGSELSCDLTGLLGLVVVMGKLWMSVCMRR